MKEYIIDQEKQYYASVEFCDTCAALCFKSVIKCKEQYISKGDTIQGWADEVFEHLKTQFDERIMDTDFFTTPTGVKDLTMFGDDGNFIVDWSEQGYKTKDIKKGILEFFNKIYFDNKDNIKEQIRKGFAGEFD